MIIQRFEQQVRDNPDRVIIKTDSGSFTYSELDHRARRIAGGIDAAWPAATETPLVGLFLEDAFHMIAAMIGVLKTGRAYVPLSADYPAHRLSYMIEHSGAPLILTDHTHRETVRELTGDGAAVLELEDIGHARPPVRRDGELMYVLYTSGSTGTPKGVMHHRESALHSIERYIEDLSLTADDHLTFFSSFSHDAAVMDVYAALLSGAVLHPLNIKELPDLSALAPWLLKERITVYHSVPTVYRYFVNALKMNGSHTFPALRYIVLGGEAVIAHDLDMFHEYFAAPGTVFYNLYGQTESSYNSGMAVTRNNPADQITLGRVVRGTQILLIDQYGNAADTLETGEIIIAGPSVSAGYWQDEEATKTSFREHPKYGRMYRTGDLGRLLPDPPTGGAAQIEFIGRKDSQVKIRGFRVELGEIESLLLKHEAVSEAVVTVKENKSGDKYLCAHITGAGTAALSSTETLGYLALHLPDYMVPTYFVELERMPLTPSGKIDRNALPEPQAEINARHVAPRDAVEEQLTAIWAGVLEMEKDDIGIDDNFFQLGGHSLKATVMAAAIHKKLNVTLPLADIFNTPTVRGLSENIKKQADGDAEDAYAAIEPVEDRDFYPMSAAQSRLYFLQQMEGDSSRFNISVVLKLEGAIEKERVEHAFKRLIRRHESFRTSFEMLENLGVQRIHDAVDFSVEYFDIHGGGEGAGERDIVRRFLRSFDLSRAPLLRVGMIKTAPDSHILMVDMHHIIADGSSLRVAVREFIAFYGGEALPPLAVQYKDFAAWQNQRIESGRVGEQEAYWLNRFAGEIPVLNMPLDHPRPAVYKADGGYVAFSVDKAVTAALKQAALEMEMTMYILLLGAYTILLSKYAGREDIVVGSPVAGRRHADLRNTVGLFANMMAMRNQPRGDITLSEFLNQVKTNALDAFENQDYQFDRLVRELNIKTESGRTPLFDAVFVLQNTMAGDIRVKNRETLSEMKVSHYDAGVEKVHHELLLTTDDSGETLYLELHYAVELYKESTARNLLKHYGEILEQVVTKKDVLLKDIRISHDFIAAQPGIVEEDPGDFRL